MLYGKSTFDELIKSTLVTLSLFTLFDILIQGYLNYHSLFISGVILGLISFTLYKRFQQHF